MKHIIVGLEALAWLGIYAVFVRSIVAAVRHYKNNGKW